MKVYQGKDIRNVGVVGHGDCGKTSLVAALLQAAGATQRLGRVDDGTTVTDFDEEEIERKVTISTALAYAEWATASNGTANKVKINLLDTPGHQSHQRFELQATRQNFRGGHSMVARWNMTSTTPILHRPRDYCSDVPACRNFSCAILEVRCPSQPISVEGYAYSNQD
mgnify:CR=1 FL=1